MATRLLHDPPEQLLAVGLFAWVVAGAAPGVDWLDSGNLAAAAWTMGVAHPPGEPAYLALAHLAQLVPIGDLAFRVTLLSAACLAGCALALAAAIRRSDGRLPPGGLLLIAAALVGFGARAQGVRPEVYAPTALIAASALAIALRGGGLRATAGVGLLLGVGAGVHPLLLAAAVPALAVARLARKDVGPRDVAALGIAGGVGFAVQAWLPLRAAALPARAWGLPNAPDRFLDVLLARTFASNFGGDGSGAWIENLEVVLRLWSRAGLPLLVVLGVVAALRAGAATHGRPGGPALMVIALVWLAGNAWTVVPQNKVLVDNPDLLGYLLIGIIGVVPAAAAGLPRAGRAGAMLTLFALGMLAADGARASRSDAWQAHGFATAQSAGLPTGSILLVSGNDTAFSWTWLEAVERRRVDLALVPRVLLGHDHELVRLGGQPGLARLGLTWSPDLRADPVAQLSRATRPAFLEIREPEQRHLDAGLLHRHGLVARLGGPAGAEDPWLRVVRERTLADLAAAPCADAQAQQVEAYYRTLWDDAP